MEIAIIGAGFAGKGAAYYLQNLGHITVFDKGESSCSRLAAGLLHKFSGLNASKNPFADEAFPLALDLINQKTKTGLLRQATTAKQLASFKKAALLWPEEIKLIDEETLWIEEAYIVDCPAYLASLNYEKRVIRSLKELDNFDLIVVAGGADSLDLAPELPINPIAGQLIDIKGNNYPLQPITGEIYTLPLTEHMIVGSTYERSPQDAQVVLLPKLSKMLPNFELKEVLSVKKGVRASTPDHMPFIKQINDKTWALSGFGSKGFLYHAWYGKKLAEQISFI